jgi:hypothetical protein
MAGKLTELDPNCAHALSVGYAHLDKPSECRSGIALLLDCGGDDGYWMRMIGGEADHRRVGALLISAQELVYVEGYSAHSQPKSTLGFAKILAQGKQRAFGDYLIAADSERINKVEFEPVVPSEHGAVAVLTISVEDVPWRFGIRAGIPTTPALVTAACALAGGADMAGRTQAEPLREDGIYVVASDTPKHKFNLVRVEDGRAYSLSVHNPRKALDELHSREWSPPSFAVSGTDGHYVLTNDQGEKKWELYMLGEGRIAKQLAAWQGENEATGIPDTFSEMAFVSDDELQPGWGLAQGRYYVPDWGVQLDNEGQLVAPDLGRIPEGSSVSREYLEQWAMIKFNVAVREAGEGKEFRRKAWAIGVGEEHFSKEAKKTGDEIRADHAHWPTPEASEKRILLALIYSVEHDGQTWVHCDAYDAETGASVTIEQPYRERMMSFKTTGEAVIGGPAEPLKIGAE